MAMCFLAPKNAILSFANSESFIRARLVHSHILPSQSVANHNSVITIKSVAKKFKAKLWQKLLYNKWVI
jgi:hypothetical protein